MYSKYAVLSLICSLLFVGCSAVVDNHYLVLSRDPRAPVASLEQIVISTDPVRLVPGDITRGELKEESPLLTIDGNRSVYELLSFAADANQQFNIVVDGMIMGGLGHAVVVPQVVVVDELGGVVPTNFSRKQQASTWTEPASMRATISGKAARNSSLFVVVMADNKIAGKPVGLIGEIPVYPSPYGLFRVALTLTPR